MSEDNRKSDHEGGAVDMCIDTDFLSLISNICGEEEGRMLSPSPEPNLLRGCSISMLSPDYDSSLEDLNSSADCARAPRSMLYGDDMDSSGMGLDLLIGEGEGGCSLYHLPSMYNNRSPPSSPVSTTRLTDAASEGPSCCEGGGGGSTMIGSFGKDGDHLSQKGVGTGGPRRKRPRSHPDDEDARLIALETELHLKKLNLDPDSREGKVEKRKVQNRMSAQMHRERKRAYIETLEDEIRGRDETIRKMRQYIKELEKSVRAAGGTVSGLALGEKGGKQHETAHTGGHSTTSESGSDAGYSSTTSASYKDRKPGGATLGLSLFSLVFMMTFGFTLMAKPDMLGSFISSSGTAGSSSAVYTSSGAHRMSIDEGRGWEGHGRVLLATTPADNAVALHTNGHDDDDDAAVSNPSPPISLSSLSAHAHGQILSVPSILDHTPAVRGREGSRAGEAASVAGGGNTSLWNFEEPVAHLYHPVKLTTNIPPRAHVETTGPATGSGALVTTFPESSLRGSMGATQRRHEASAAEEQRALIASSKPFVDTSSHDSSHRSALGPSYYPSQILMTEGKALLDPSLVQSPRVVHRKSFGFANPTDEVVHVHNMASSKNNPDVSESEFGTALVPSSSWYRPPSGGRESVFSAHTPSNTHADRVVDSTAASSSPQFVMMLPLNSVKWGTSWDEDDSLDNPLTQLLKTLQQQDNSSSPSSPFDTDSYWIEIGCSVMKAQLVKNVTLA